MSQEHKTPDELVALLDEIIISDVDLTQEQLETLSYAKLALLELKRRREDAAAVVAMHTPQQAGE